MKLFHKSNGQAGFMDVIRCDEPSYLIWKWRPEGAEPSTTGRENAIRWGSSLRVKAGEVAVFVYRQPNGIMQDFIEGPFDQTINTDNFPVLASIVGLAFGGGTPFQAEIFFINLAQVIQVPFAVPFFEVYDPRLPDFGVPVSVRGTMSFQIGDYRQFIQINRLREFTLTDFQKQVRDAAARYVKDAVTNAPAAHNIPVIQIESKIAQINDAVEYDLIERMRDNFGVDASAVDIGAIEIDKTSIGYQQLMAVTKGVTTVKVEAETLDYVERMRIQREEGQYALHKQTQSANLGAFQVEQQAAVGIAGAEALGQMGANGAGDVHLGDGGGGMNMAAMMAGMAVGGAVGQNIAGTMNHMIGGMGQSVQPPMGQPYPGSPYGGPSYPGAYPAGQPYPGQPYVGQGYPGVGMMPPQGQPYPGQPMPGHMGQPYATQPYGGQTEQSVMSPPNGLQQEAGVAPPPIPMLTYHVAINGQSGGPYDLPTLTQMAAVGQLTAEHLVWRPGMVEWVKAGTVAELAGLFVVAPPTP